MAVHGMDLYPHDDGTMKFRVWFWFAGSERLVVESDMDGGEGASSEAVFELVYGKMPSMGLMGGLLREAGLDYLRESYLGLGLGLPEVHVRMFLGEIEVARMRWDWGAMNLGEHLGEMGVNFW